MIGKTDPMMAWLRVAGSLIFVAGGLFLVTRPDAGWKMLVGGGAGIVVFGLFAILSLRMAFENGDQLTIDDLGVFDRRSTDRLIPWSQILGHKEMSLKGNWFIYLDVGDDPMRFTDSLAKRAYLAMNQSFGPGVLINTNGLDVSHERVIAELERRLRSSQAGMP